MKGSRNIIDYLNDIIFQIKRIHKFIDNISFDQFKENDEKISAVIYCLAIIGEAANRIPQQTRQKHNEIAWRKIISMRNILIHYYYGTDEMIIWKTIVKDLPELEIQMNAMLESMNEV